MNRYSDYDGLAWLYDRHWGHAGDQVVPVLERLVLPALPEGARVLDLCCGSGRLAQALTARGYRVTGLDGSEEMVGLARARAPGAEFVVADARSFSLPGTYDGVVSTFDSLNHVMSLEELVSVFGNVRSSLVGGGLFFFDLNTEEGYRADWHGSFGIVEDEYVCVARSSYSPTERTAHFRATMFRLQDGWQRSDLTLRQRCYSEAEVRSALETAGFTDIDAYGCDAGQGPVAFTEAHRRVFFLCRAPK